MNSSEQTAGGIRATLTGMDPRMLDLVCEGIAAGLCPIADDDDLRELLTALERLTKGNHGSAAPHAEAHDANHAHTAAARGANRRTAAADHRSAATASDRRRWRRPR